MPLATSLEPCANAMAEAVNSSIGVNTFSTAAKSALMSSPPDGATRTRAISRRPMNATSTPTPKAIAKLCGTLRSTFKCFSPLNTVTSVTTKPTIKTYSGAHCFAFSMGRGVLRIRRRMLIINRKASMPPTIGETTQLATMVLILPQLTAL